MKNFICVISRNVACSCFSISAFLAMLMITSCNSEEHLDPYVPDRYVIDDVSVSIAKYADNKEAAMALTFDDGTQDQYQHALPELEKRQLPATFFINGWRIRETAASNSSALSIPDLQDMVKRGFEVSNHTFNHTKLTTISLDSAAIEMQKNDSVIEMWTGVRPVTFAFPNNARNEDLIALAMKGRVGVRTYEQGFGQTYRTTTYSDMVKWANQVIEDKTFGVAMYHGVESGYDYWNSPNELMSFFDYLVTCRDRLWLGTFRDISSYSKERDNSNLNMSMSHDTLQIDLESPLDTTLFKYPLTLVVSVKDSISFTTSVRPGKSVAIPLLDIHQ